VFDGLAEWDDWSIPGMLYRLEGFNGWGYRLYHPEVKSPYLWSGSTHYTSGKYIADGTWSDTAVSRQNGAATILRRIAEKNELDADSHIPDESLAAAMSKNVALYAYAPRKISTAGIELQRFLNGFPGVFLKEDGRLGPKTSAAFYTIFGKYLQGDPRNEQASAIA
jgi:hypothetical protein